MNFNFLRTAVATPHIQLTDCDYNSREILAVAKNAYSKGVELLITPELGITGYSCGDLFQQQILLQNAIKSLHFICQETASLKMLLVVGLPVLYENKIYNCAAVLYEGTLLGLVPKTNLPNYSEFYEQRQFTPAGEFSAYYSDEYFDSVPFSKNILFQDTNNSLFTFAAEICEDLWVPSPPSISHAVAGALIIGNLSAGNELVGKADYRRGLVVSQSAKLSCAYLYASAGSGESTTDAVFAGHNIIAENGVSLAETKLFSEQIAITEIDLDRLSHDRILHNTYPTEQSQNSKYIRVFFDHVPNKTTLKYRNIPRFPFVPQQESLLNENCETILNIQANGLCRRILHTKAKSLVLGISGGLDSTLALLICLRAIENTPLSRKDIIAITMPAFGTTERTKSNAEKLAEITGVTLRTINITDSVRQHFSDIGHDENTHDVVYENAQARTRTLVLMDVANAEGGLVIGTGDLSELALGWATYNGDHMSMYGVNASVPKTLIRYLVQYEANRSATLQKVLEDVLATPVSPELLPAVDGKISQQTENIVGPYELHDFFLYYILRWGYSPGKIFFLAQHAFKSNYDNKTILSWMRIFYQRFFASQFKRSCLPDGPKVGSVSLSPRADWRMPSDASSALWLQELDTLTNTL